MLQLSALSQEYSKSLYPEYSCLVSCVRLDELIEKMICQYIHRYLFNCVFIKYIQNKYFMVAVEGGYVIPFSSSRRQFNASVPPTPLKADPSLFLRNNKARCIIYILPKVCFANPKTVTCFKASSKEAFQVKMLAPKSSYYHTHFYNSVHTDRPSSIHFKIALSM